MRRRRVDPDAPLPCQGWQDTVTLQPPQSKEQVTLRLDRDVLEWFRAKGRATRLESTRYSAPTTCTSNARSRNPGSLGAGNCDDLPSRFDLSPRDRA